MTGNNALPARYRCKKCKSMNIEAIYYMPHSVSFIQNEGVMQICHVNGADGIELVNCFDCGNWGDDRLEEV